MKRTALTAIGLSAIVLLYATGAICGFDFSRKAIPVSSGELEERLAIAERYDAALGNLNDINGAMRFMSEYPKLEEHLKSKYSHSENEESYPVPRWYVQGRDTYDKYQRHSVLHVIYWWIPGIL